MQCVFAIMACSKQITTTSEAPEVHGNEDIPGCYAGSLVQSIGELHI